MFLSKLTLDPQHPQARRDLGDAYEMHRTLARVYAPDAITPPPRFLWRLEPSFHAFSSSALLVQSDVPADWSVLDTMRGYTAEVLGNKLVDLEKLIRAGARYRFRLRANPCVTREGKRLGLVRTDEQEAWLERKGKQHGFSLPQLASFDFSETPQDRIDVRISQEQMLQGKQHTGNGIRIYSVLYDGILMVTEPDNFRAALQTGIGHGKAMGLGLMSVAPVAPMA